MNEFEEHYRVSFKNKKDGAYLEISCDESSDFPSDSMFSSLEGASSFFKNGSLGYPPTRSHGVFQSLELRTDCWKVEPLRVEKVVSSYFNNQKLFPNGSIRFDHALVMKNIEHRWIAGKKLKS